MLTIVPGVLDSSQLEQAREWLAAGDFVDGQLSAGDMARTVKRNEELATDPARTERLNALIMGALLQHPLFQAAAMPLKVATPFYARYTAGMYYGDHVDDPVMGPPGAQYRSDVSSTVFLNPPEQYEGGELMIRTPYGNQRIKLAAGDAVVYPSSSLHHVAEVTAGERLVAVTWIQSMIRNAHQRELLLQLYQLRENLRDRRPDSDEAGNADQVYVNLVRMWSEL